MTNILAISIFGIWLLLRPKGIRMSQTARLYFIDTIRAWAILMMLQGHFIDGMLDNSFRDMDNPIYLIWRYFRGITAPVFFSVSGFIFTYLLVRNPQAGIGNPRVKKGLKRGVQLILIGYLLRTNIFGLLHFELYPAFFKVDVLHCIGLSLIVIIGLYFLAFKSLSRFLILLLSAGMALFILEPWYDQLDYSNLPIGLANYFTRDFGSVFTIVPWMGYTAMGGALSLIFKTLGPEKYRRKILGCGLIGLLLIFTSSALFSWLGDQSGLSLFHGIANNNYLFIRLGDVLVVFAVFMLLRRFLTHPLWLQIGQNTLPIYNIHFVLLYGSFTGIGLYRYWNHTLSPTAAISGAVLFLLGCTYLALAYQRPKTFVGAQYQRLSSAWAKWVAAVRDYVTSLWETVPKK